MLNEGQKQKQEFYLTLSKLRSEAISLFDVRSSVCSMINDHLSKQPLALELLNPKLRRLEK